MRNKIASLAGAILLAGGAAIATASSASAADWDHTWTTTDSAHGGTVSIQEHGDIVHLCDTSADGYAPRVDVATQSSSGQYNSRYGLTASGGKGVCVEARASDGGSHDLPESDNILVAIWLGPTKGTSGSDHVFLNDH